jgi:hypothetical protein
MNSEVNDPLKGGPNGHLPLTIIIEGREFQWPKQFITGRELRQLAGLPENADLFLGITDPWDDEQVGLDDRIDIAREGVESFYVRNPLSFLVGEKHHQWKKQHISGLEVRKLAGVLPSDEIYLLLQKPYEDEVIGDKTQVNLARPGIEHFWVKKKGEELRVTIRINDTALQVKRGKHTVAELKKLGGVLVSDQLSELVKGKLVALADNGTANVKGGEEFFSCKREGSSS